MVRFSASARWDRHRRNLDYSPGENTHLGQPRNLNYSRGKTHIWDIAQGEMGRPEPPPARRPAPSWDRHLAGIGT